MVEIKDTTKSIFLAIMGSNPTNKILDFLIVFDKFDYSMKDIARNSKVSYTTLKSLWKDFEKYNIMELSRKVGKAKLYRLNKKNPIVKQIIKTYWTITNSEILKEVEKGSEKAKIKVESGGREIGAYA